MIVSSPPLTVGISALILKWFKRIPFIFEIRDLWPESAIDTRVLTNKFMIKAAFSLESRLYQKAHLINVLTPAMQDVLITKKSIAAEKIVYFPNAADFDISDRLLATFDKVAFRKKIGIPDNITALCYVGAHGVANHLIQIIEAAEILKNEPVMFFLIGDGMLKQQLINTAKERGLDNMVFVDSVVKEEALKYILACDLGLSVHKKADTFKTDFSNKTFDYMACKKPVIMAIDGISTTLIETADAGTFVEPEQHLQLVQTIKMYMTQPEKIIRQGENGYNYAKSHFDRSVLASNYIKTIEQSLNKNVKLANSFKTDNIVS